MKKTNKIKQAAPQAETKPGFHHNVSFERDFDETDIVVTRSLFRSSLKANLVLAILLALSLALNAGLGLMELEKVTAVKGVDSHGRVYELNMAPVPKSYQ